MGRTRHGTELTLLIQKKISCAVAAIDANCVASGCVAGHASKDAFLIVSTSKVNNLESPNGM